MDYSQIDYNNGYIDENGNFVYIKNFKNNLKRIEELKQKLTKYKEDVEQVKLFGMGRSDYEEKKKLCADIILELRELERLLSDSSK